jgi:GT2 family glycosyltransferase
VHVVVVAYGKPEQLEGCLSALDGRAPVTVVDNSSSSDVRAVALSHGAVYVDAGANLGFAAGVNLALRPLLRGAPADVLLLNPDARLAPGELGRLGAFLHEPGRERVACVAPRLLDAGGREQRVAWPFPSPGRMWVEALGAGRTLTRADFVVGAVLLLRWEALRDVGLFDERFFLYGEEADWQRRAARHGWASAVCREVVAVHEGAGSSSDERVREVLFHAAQETYVRKWHGTLGWWVYRSAACAGAAVRTVALRGARRAEAARRVGLDLRGPRRRAAAVRG